MQALYIQLYSAYVHSRTYLFFTVDEITFEHKPSTGYLTMLFSAPVDTVRINCDQRQFTYQDAMLMPNKTFSPHRPGSCFQSSVTQITFILDTEDYVELLNEECLFRSNATAVLAWDDTLGTSHTTRHRLI